MFKKYKLKRCPYCGSEASLHDNKEYIGKSSFGNYIFVSCSTCRFIAFQTWYDCIVTHDVGDRIIQFRLTAEEAAAIVTLKWNARSGRAALNARKKYIQLIGEKEVAQWTMLG